MTYFLYFPKAFPSYQPDEVNQSQEQRLYYFNPMFSSCYYNPGTVSTIFNNADRHNDLSDSRIRIVQANIITQNQKKKKNKQPRGIDEGKQIKSAKKNSECNLMNNFFSFFRNKEGSEVIVQRILRSMNLTSSKSQKLEHLLFLSMTVFTLRKGKKYINRNTIFPLGNPHKILKIIPEIKDKMEKFGDEVSVEDICLVFRKCWNYFFKVKAIDAILTSKRIKKFSRIQHLKRKRKILQNSQKKFGA